MLCEQFCPITFSSTPTCYVCSHHRRCKKEAAVGATNTNNGKVGYKDALPNPAPMIPEI